MRSYVRTKLNVSLVTVSFIGCSVGAVTWFGVQWWPQQSPQDFEQCSDKAEKTSSSKDERMTLIAECGKQFVGRRKTGGGYTYYDLTNHHPQNQYVGLSYNTCCWALRFILSSDWNGTTQIQGSPSFQSPYTTTYYLEFLLKGLGSVGTSRAENMLTSTLPGFSDVFSNNGHYGYGSGV